jgi:hypothetical protein
MKQTMFAGLTAALVLCGALPQGATAAGAVTTVVEMHGLSEVHTKTAEPPVEDVSEEAELRLFPLLRVEDDSTDFILSAIPIEKQLPHEFSFM